MILVDTSVWIDYFNGVGNDKTDILDFYLDQDIIATGDLILIELMQGFKSKKDIELADDLLGELVYFDMAGKAVAYKTIENYKKLRKKGITVRKTIDMIIGSFCLLNNIKLLHNDKDFIPMEKYLHLQTVK